MAAIPVKIYDPASCAPSSDDALTASERASTFAVHVVGRPGNISSEVLRANLGSFLSNFGQALTNVPDALAGYHVEEVGLLLDISAGGVVSLVIGSADLECKAGIKLTLKRNRH